MQMHCDKAQCNVTQRREQQEPVSLASAGHKPIKEEGARLHAIASPL